MLIAAPLRMVRRGGVYEVDRQRHEQIPQHHLKSDERGDFQEQPREFANYIGRDLRRNLKTGRYYVWGGSAQPALRRSREE